MSAMKPDAWISANRQTGEVVHVAVRLDRPLEKVYNATPLYTLATVRKWLEEELSAAVFEAGVNCTGGIEDTYRAMLAAKLRELEGGE